ncbi:hypothetical protein K9U39_05850 [Rhodoblastus acidophilus]|uniref:Uncharacterized protein n=1 Tax=Candidatus Rhodoblastus alkanivorans TaxID=2954117 RepID=A0ABS9Z6X0_9HYPH|nr:hypothetical protein [Candidatus Rhodoblastus alkanivorans]MCI4679169.1 hypothetical protein [Candidatus Rhodoblastus alkanivorans]MCI4683165.1 hypothetical protein [Candidatus Rhodoblastus alkanivorans]MDI4640476.1 hypothetical protein [Rhodoblastus acidophilus]
MGLGEGAAKKSAPHADRVNSPPRWEWRTFGPDLAEIGAKFGLAFEAPAHCGEELYLAHVRSPHNAKIRDGLLDVKRLKATAASGLELWEVALKQGFPLSATNIRDFFEVLDLAPPVARRPSYDLEDFLERIVGRDPAFRAVPVKKSRRSFLTGACRAELVRLEIAGAVWMSFCVENESLDRVEAALRKLDLDTVANISFPKFLRSLPLWSAET